MKRANHCLLWLLLASLYLVHPPLQAQGVPVALDRLSESWWAERHQAILNAITKHPDAQIILIGDSITNNYDKAKLPDENFQPTWQRFYTPRGAVNLGFSGDTTANVLWRLEHGEIDGLHPKVAILLIGTNDTAGGRTPEQTGAGIDAFVAELGRRLPATRVLLMGVLPSAISDAKTAADKATNTYLAAKYKESRQVIFLDISSIFYLSNGELNTDIYYDPRLPHPGKPLHPDTHGQRMMAEAIEPTLARMLLQRKWSVSQQQILRFAQDDSFVRFRAGVPLCSYNHPSLRSQTSNPTVDATINPATISAPQR